MKAFLIYIFIVHSVLAGDVMYVQSPVAKLLQAPSSNSLSEPIKFGESVYTISEEGLFVKVRSGNKVGYINKLFLSAFAPTAQIKLSSSLNTSENVQARMRASDFTKTAAARGLTDQEELRVRGESHLYDFDSLVWIETNSSEKIESEPMVLVDAKKEVPKKKVPESTVAEVKVGRSIAARLIKKYGIIKNTELTRYLNFVGRKISSMTSRTDIPFLFGILNSNDINAFACPGGIILVTKGLLKSIQDESELAVILSHEISHVVLFHSGDFEEMNFLLEVISGFLGPSGGEIISVGNIVIIEKLEKQLISDGRDQSLEFEADEAGALLASSLGFIPQKYETYLERISKLNEAKLLSSTHPSYKERIEGIKDLAKSLPKSEVKSFTINLDLIKKNIP
jgi:beta-barrel assembly-enhancing protease